MIRALEESEFPAGGGRGEGVAAAASGDVPVNRYPGEIFCSRYGIHVDFAVDPEGHKALFDVLFLVDGTRSVADIAAECGVPEATVLGILDQLRHHGLLAARSAERQLHAAGAPS